jgi:hypothetical protein
VYADHPLESRAGVLFIALGAPIYWLYQRASAIRSFLGDVLALTVHARTFAAAGISQVGDTLHYPLTPRPIHDPKNAVFFKDSHNSRDAALQIDRSFTIFQRQHQCDGSSSIGSAAGTVGDIRIHPPEGKMPRHFLRERTPAKALAAGPRPVLEVTQLPIIRVHYRRLEEYLARAYQMEGFDFLLASGVAPGLVPEYAVRATFPPPEDARRRADAIRAGRRTRDVPPIRTIVRIERVDAPRLHCPASRRPHGLAAPDGRAATPSGDCTYRQRRPGSFAPGSLAGRPS